MKTIAAVGLAMVIAAGCVSLRAADSRPDIEIADLALEGEIQGDNLTFTLTFSADVRRGGTTNLLAQGAVSALETTLPHGAELLRDGDAYRLRFDRRGKQTVTFKFAAQAASEGDLRHARFTLPEAAVRKVTVTGDRPDLDLQFNGALNVERGTNTAGRMSVSAFLSVGSPLDAQWKPKVRKLAGELAVSCDANTVAAARVGALQIDSLLTFRVVQGTLQKIVMDIPAALNVTQVRGADIREWTLEPVAAGGAATNQTRLLTVTLNRPQENAYPLHIEAEQVLPSFPANFDFPLVVPRDVIRTSGFLAVGADGAIKVSVQKAAGLTQIDQAAFQVTKADPFPRRAVPARSVYAYQYANVPFQMQLSADDVVTTLHAEDGLVLSLSDADLALAATVELDIRDAPVRETMIETDPAWIVASVAGANVADYDVRDEAGVRKVRVTFKEDVIGRALLNLRLEHTLKDDAAGFDLPVLRVPDAKSERGHIVLRAEKGVRLVPGEVVNLREVHTGSLPMNVAGAQRAYRFKEPGWKLPVKIEKEEPAVHAEIFHLVSLGEGGLYGSSTITYVIGGAPTRIFRIRIPKEFQNVEITGRDIRTRQQEGDLWTVTLQDKVIGDYTLLATYHVPAAFDDKPLRVGGVRTEGPESETGYIALAGVAAFAVEDDAGRDPTILPVTAEELPKEYAMLVNAPVLRAFKYVRAPHEAVVRIRRYVTQPLLGQVSDHMTLATRISREGEAVTEATCFVKNTSQQYLGLKLPAGARLWSAAVDGQKVQALDKGEGAVLLPLDRRRDPNQPLRVQFTYAEQNRDLRWAARPQFAAPTLDTRSVFARWTFVSPDDYRILDGSGNMMQPVRPDGGVTAFALAVLRFWRELFSSGLAWVFLSVILFATLSPIRWNAGRGRPWSWSTWLSAGFGLALIAGLLVLAPDWELKDAFEATPGWIPGQSWELTKPVTLAEGGLSVTLLVARTWVAVAGYAGVLAAGLLLGLFLAWRLRRRGRRVTGAALAVVVVAWALSLIPPALPWGAGITALALPLALGIGWLRFLYRRGLRRRPPASPPSAPAGESFAARIPPAPPAPPAPAAGAAAVALLLIALGVAAPLTTRAEEAKPAAAQTAQAAAPAQAPVAAPAPQPEPPPVMKLVTATIEAPKPGDDQIRNARISLTVDFSCEKAVRFMILPAPRVLTDHATGSDRVRVVPGEGGYFIEADRGGDYRVTLGCLAAVAESNGAREIAAWLPPNIRNEISVRVPAAAWEIASPQAVLLTPADSAAESAAKIVAGPVSDVRITWRPRERKTQLEKAVFFCEVNSFALFQAGLVSLTHLVRYQIAQGELQALQMKIPEGISVTAVNGPGLGTWRFDPDTRRLEALLEKPVSGEYTLIVSGQITRESLPYDVDLRPPEVEGASRQRGAIAVAATDAVQTTPGELTGCSSMNIGDFAPEATKMGLQSVRQGGVAEVKRAFRYHQVPATAHVAAVRVLPELRVMEESQLDISDERLVLSSRLKVSIAKSGLFSLSIDLPEGFDIDSLTGDDVSHWDEVREGARGVLVHFVKQALGDRTINLVLSRMERRSDPKIVAPRIGVRDALKHTGTLTVSGERGLRFTTVRRDGVTEVNPRELGVQQTGYLAFRLLRPDWTVELQTESMLPVVRCETLHRVDVSEGMLHTRTWLQYTIDHAGVKTFRLRAPRPGIALTVAGKNISRIQEMDAAQGLWEVELHNKVEASYALEVSAQEPFEHETNTVRAAVLRAEGVDAQRGWIVVMSGGRLQVRPSAESPEGLRPEDPRGVPASFGAGDLSGAILCYRFMQPGAALTLSVQRHASAEVLAARVRRAALTSVVSDDGQLVTRSVLDMDVGSLRFLEVRLPEGSELWSTFVNGKPVLPLVEKGTHLIPLESAGASASVECIYAGRGAAGGWSNRQEYRGPKFNLPLADLGWEFYLPPQYRYHGFGGTLIHRDEDGAIVTYDTEQYDRDNSLIVAANAKKAVEVLEQGSQLAKAGRQIEARQAFEEAVQFSQGQQALNEDARIQFRNLAKQQAVVSFANRRAALKRERNLSDEQGAQQLVGFNGGNWSADYQRKVEESLGAKENESLGVVADKLMEQQAAAEAEVHPIRVTMPLQGLRLMFRRDLQITPGADMIVTLRAGAGGWLRGLYSALSFAGLALLAGLAVRAVAGGRKP